MQVLQNLAILVLASQALASVLLVISAVFDRSTHERVNSPVHVAIPTVRKIVALFRATTNRWMLGVYFLSLVFVVFSYAGFVLLVIQVVDYVVF